MFYMMSLSLNKIFIAFGLSGADRTTTSSEAVISDKVFGTNGDSANLKSQYVSPLLPFTLINVM